VKILRKRMKILKIEKIINCPKCHGIGVRKKKIKVYADIYTILKTCTICNGKGKVRIDFK
jgi:DnaJ-class molecular chaperone